MVRLTGRPDMTLDVYRGRKTTTQQQQRAMGGGGGGGIKVSIDQRVVTTSKHKSL